MKRFDLPVMHRSWGWKPLYNEETISEDWVKGILIPQLNKLSKSTWQLVGGNLLHTTGKVVMDGDFFAENPLAAKIKKLYPTLKEDDFGFKIERRLRAKKCTYEGTWALSTDSIVTRGSIAGQRFGL